MRAPQPPLQFLFQNNTFPPDMESLKVNNIGQ